MQVPVKTPDECSSIEEVRAEIDRLDEQIVTALGQRFAYVKAVTRFKKTAADVQATERIRVVLSSRRQWAVDAGLDPAVIEQMYRDLIAYFIAEEKKILHLPEA